MYSLPCQMIGLVFPNTNNGAILYKHAMNANMDANIVVKEHKGEISYSVHFLDTIVIIAPHTIRFEISKIVSK